MPELCSIRPSDRSAKCLGTYVQRVLYILSLSFLTLVGTAASSTSLAAQETKELVVGVSGESVTPKQYNLTLEAGSVADRAIRVYSEPSHTFLALVLDSGFKDALDFSSWEESISSFDEPRATIVTSLPLGRPRVTIQPPPEGDFAISVWVYGTWPDGMVEDRLVAEAKVGGPDFEFSTYVKSDPFAKGAGPGQQEHCCKSTCCPEKCVTCDGWKFSCCTLAPQPSSCCFVECGWGGSCGANCSC